ncbi:hypothetical protein EMMF5_002086 [Cystobasidiomycetes sp. EMM_F5]
MEWLITALENTNPDPEEQVSILQVPMPSPKPTLVFVPGAWHSPACFDPIIARLLEIGYSCATVSLPSVGPSAHALADPNADSAAVRSVIVEQLEFKKDVVLVAHSYAGIPTNNAIEGLVKQRDATFGVIGIVYLAAFLVSQGQTLAATLAAVGEQGLAPFIEVQEVVFEPWRYLPAYYMLALEDACVLPRIQEAMLNQIGEERFKKVVRIQCGHAPFLSRQDETIALIEEAAGALPDKRAML